MKKILIIDDDPSFLGSVERSLRSLKDKAEIIPAECHSTEEALGIIRDNTPDVILLDHHLTEGGGEGWEIATEVKKQWPGIKIISTTSDRKAGEFYEEQGIPVVGKMDPLLLRETLQKML